MSAILDLPSELYGFLARPAPQTILIRGPPGTGKTTLSLGLLENFGGRRFLVSSRVSSPELLHEFPWIANGGNIQLVDATRAGSIKEASRAVSNLRSLVQEPEREDELRALWLPDAVQEAWSRSDSTTPSMVVIDSWDALVERFLGSVPAGEGLPDRAELERMLLDQMGRGPVFLVLVTERAEPTQLDYLVNAVLENSSRGDVGRPERWVHLRKLRGTRIESPSYPFTLDGGRFQCIGHMPVTFLEGNYRPQDEPPGPAEGIWSGSADFDAAFGRLPVGHISLLEVDLGVPTEALVQLASPIAAVVARKGGRMLHILPPNIGASDALRLYGQVLTPDEINRQIRFQPSGSVRDVPPEMEHTMLPPPASGERGTGPRTPEAARFFTESAGPGTTSLAIIWVPALRAFAAEGNVSYTPETLPGVALAYLSGAPAHLMFVGPEDDPLVRSLQTMAALRIRLKMNAGRVFVWGEQPATPSYILSQGDPSARTPYRLLRIV